MIKLLGSTFDNVGKLYEEEICSANIYWYSLGSGFQFCRLWLVIFSSLLALIGWSRTPLSQFGYITVVQDSVPCHWSPTQLSTQWWWQQASVDSSSSSIPLSVSNPHLMLTRSLLGARFRIGLILFLSCQIIIPYRLKCFNFNNPNFYSKPWIVNLLTHILCYYIISSFVLNLFFVVGKKHGFLHWS